jgi:hypothetical protein
MDAQTTCFLIPPRRAFRRFLKPSRLSVASIVFLYSTEIRQNIVYFVAFSSTIENSSIREGEKFKMRSNVVLFFLLFLAFAAQFSCTRADLKCEI